MQIFSNDNYNRLINFISLNTSKLKDDEAKNVINKFKKMTDLPVTDPIRFGIEELAQNIFD